MLSRLFLRIGGPPAFRIHGKARRELDWRVIDVLATPRRNIAGGWRGMGGSCITWTPQVIVVGWDFAQRVLLEQANSPATREQPLEVCDGRLNYGRCPASLGTQRLSEVLAHECGHTYQARRLGPLYLPTGALFTWWREGPHWWNRFENDASECGQFGGILAESVRPDLRNALLPSS